MIRTETRRYTLAGGVNKTKDGSRNSLAYIDFIADADGISTDGFERANRLDLIQKIYPS